MNNWGTLYIFELKKILKSRLTVAMLIITFIVVIVEAFAPGWSVNKEMREARKELNGRKIDSALLDEMYPNIDKYGEVWNADNDKYYNIAYIVRCIAENNTPLSEYSEKDLYSKREEYIDAAMKHDRLTDRELEWWAKKKVKTPFTYYYNGGAIWLEQGMVAIQVCIMMIAALCLSSVFTVEHRQRTDQILLSCINGRRNTFAAKIVAGLTVSLGCSLIASAILTVLIMIIYGLEGLKAVVQLEFPMSAYPITMGQFVFIQLIVMMTSGILFSVVAMAVSELLRNSMAVTGIMIGLFIFAQIDIIPTQYRLVTQMKMMLPTNIISTWSLMEHRLVNIGGHLITQYAASPILYLLISLSLVVVGAISYDRFQVTGR